VFVITAIGTLVASKLAVAIIAARFLPAIESEGYLLTLKCLACILGVFGILSILSAVQAGV
jgi:hypothetical protein